MSKPGENTQLFQVAAGEQVRSTADDVSQDRFLREVKYADFYAKQIGECLGMRSVNIGLIEDSNGQVAFCYAPDSTGESSVVNGFITVRPRVPSRIISELTKDD